MNFNLNLNYNTKPKKYWTETLKFRFENLDPNPKQQKFNL